MVLAMNASIITILSNFFLYAGGVSFFVFILTTAVYDLSDAEDKKEAMLKFILASSLLMTFVSFAISELLRG